MTKLQNVVVALVNMDIFQMTLKLSSFTVDFRVICITRFVLQETNKCKCEDIFLLFEENLFK